MLNLIQIIAMRLRAREEGQTFVEYALLIGGVSLLLLAVFAGLSGALGDLVTTIEDELSPGT